MPSVRYNTAETFIGAFKDLSVETFLSIQAPTCHHIFAPASLPPPPPLDNAGFAAHLKSLQGVLKNFPVTAKEIIEDPVKNQVVVWATSATNFHEEVRDNEENWLFRGEYIFILTMDESQTKIERVVEFLDSKATERLRGLMAKARENKKKLGIPDTSESWFK